MGPTPRGSLAPGPQHRLTLPKNTPTGPLKSVRHKRLHRLHIQLQPKQLPTSQSRQACAIFRLGIPDVAGDAEARRPGGESQAHLPDLHSTWHAGQAPATQKAGPASYPDAGTDEAE